MNLQLQIIVGGTEEKKTCNLQAEIKFKEFVTRGKFRKFS